MRSFAQQSKNASRWLCLALSCGALTFSVSINPLLAQEPLVEAEAANPVEVVSPILRNKSFFTDRIGSCIIYFDTIIGAPEFPFEGNESLTIIDTEVFKTPDSETYQSIAVVRFLPKRTGIATLPSFSFRSSSKEYVSKSTGLRVSEPRPSERLSLAFTVPKGPFYTGQAIRLDMVLRIEVADNSVRNLQVNPSFLNDERVTVVIPKNTESEKSQVGLPLGGRRVVGTRKRAGTHEGNMGELHLPIFIEVSEPGFFKMDATRAECSLLAKSTGSFGQYSPHFNNGLFELPDTAASYSRIYTESDPIAFEVLPLPADTGAPAFSGLFEPVDLSVGITPSRLKIGEIGEANIHVLSTAPHGMLELPQIYMQRGLRSRFLVEKNFRRLWQQSGTLFRARFRPLTDTIDAFPALTFKTFDPKSGAYLVRETAPIPLSVKSSDDQSFIALETFPNTKISLTQQPEGAWHNLKPSFMNSVINTFYLLSEVAFWPLVALPPILFLIAHPIANERRKRAKDPKYRAKQEAFARFKKAPQQSFEQWQAFIALLATTGEHHDQAWTARDSERTLKALDVSKEDIQNILDIHQKLDAGTYASNKEETEFSSFSDAAKRIAGVAIKASALAIAIFILSSQNLQADAWDDAEALFEKAQASQSGSSEYSALLQEAAFKYQTAAIQDIHTGEAWYNAGNAWFQTGEMGRAIAAFRQAEKIRPFDTNIEAGLTAARALSLTAVDNNETWIEKTSTPWLKIILLVVNAIYWTVLFFALQKHTRPLTFATAIIGIALLVISVTLIVRVSREPHTGTIIVESVFAKKGPSYAYANAFNEPLHDGLEFILIEQREDWALIKLEDARQCWIPVSQAQLILK